MDGQMETTSKPKKKKFSFTSSTPVKQQVRPPVSSADDDGAAGFEVKLGRILVRSLLDQSARRLDHGYVLTSVRQAVVPEPVEARWREKRSELERLRKRFTERYLFYLTSDEAEVSDILANGLKCTDSDEDERNLLGSSRCGLTLSKHLDVSLLNEYRKRTTKFYCLVVKTLLTSSLEFVEATRDHHAKLQEASWTPRRDFDWSVSRTMASTAQTIKQRLVSSLAYLYDYAAASEPAAPPLRRPRNLVPFAVLTYELERPGEFDASLLAPCQAPLTTTTADQLREGLHKYRASTQGGAKFSSSTQLLLSIRPLKCVRVNKDFRQEATGQADHTTTTAYPGHETDDYFCQASVQGEKVPKTLIMRELDPLEPVEFKSHKRMVVKINDLKAVKNFKYMDEAKTRMNVNDSTNKLIFLYQSKRFPTNKSAPAPAAVIGKSQSLAKKPLTTGKTLVKPESKAVEAAKKVAVVKTAVPTVKAASIPTAKPVAPKPPALTTTSGTSMSTKDVAAAKRHDAAATSLSAELTTLERQLMRQPLKTRPAVAKTGEKPAVAPVTLTTTAPVKRRKSFWDREEADEERHSSDSDLDDVVVVSKRNLNLPPVQYSKQYYDSNMSGLESELKKFDFSSVASLKPAPQSATNPPVVTTTTVTKLAAKKPVQQQQQSPAALQQLKRAQRAGLLLANRQRYLHHIVTASSASAAATAPASSKLDVDNLKYLYDTSVLYSSHLSSNDEEEVPCFEINAGGFRCIHQFRHRRASLLHNFRRSKSYGNALLDLPAHGGIFHSQSSISLTSMDTASTAAANKQRISLNDYVSLRARQHSFPLAAKHEDESSTPKTAEQQLVKSENNDSDDCLKTEISNDHTTSAADDYNSNYDQIEQDTMDELIKSEKDDLDLDLDLDHEDRTLDHAVDNGDSGKKGRLSKRKSESYDATLTPDDESKRSAASAKRKKKTTKKAAAKKKRRRGSTSSSSSFSSDLLSSKSGEDDQSSSRSSSSPSSRSRSSSSSSSSISLSEIDDEPKRQRTKKSKKRSKSHRRRSKDAGGGKKLKKRRRTCDEVGPDQEDGELQDEDYDDFGDAQLEEELLFKKFKLESQSPKPPLPGELDAPVKKETLSPPKSEPPPGEPAASSGDIKPVLVKTEAEPNPPVIKSPPRRAAEPPARGRQRPVLTTPYSAPAPQFGRSSSFNNHNNKKPLVYNTPQAPPSRPMGRAPARQISSSFVNNSNNSSKLTPNMNGAGLLGAAPANFAPVVPVPSMPLHMGTPPLASKPLPKYGDLPPFAAISDVPPPSSFNPAGAMMKGPRGQSGGGFGNSSHRKGYSNNGAYLAPKAAPPPPSSYNSGYSQYPAPAYGGPPDRYEPDDYYSSSSYYDSRGSSSSGYYDPDPLYPAPPPDLYDQGYGGRGGHHHYGGRETATGYAAPHPPPNGYYGKHFSHPNGYYDQPPRVKRRIDEEDGEIVD